MSAFSLLVRLLILVPIGAYCTAGLVYWLAPTTAVFWTVFAASYLLYASVMTNSDVSSRLRGFLR